MARLTKSLELKTAVAEAAEGEALKLASRLRQLEATLALAQPLLQQAHAYRTYGDIRLHLLSHMPSAC